MTDDNTNQKKRRAKWTTSYSKMTIPEAEKRLGFWIDELRAVTVDTMLVNAKHCLKGTDAIKEKVYDRILECLANEGYPTEASADFKEANVSDFVYAIIGPILFDFGRKTGRKRLRLVREKEIISTDNETGGTEEFVVMDRISVGQERFVVIMEAKRSSLGEAMKQCLLAMKDARDNGGGEVYGFVTTGDTWRMLKYDGKFQMTNKMEVLFDTMDEDKEKWMKDYSILVDCMYTALNNGGIVKKADSY
ncbi:hypothetical protein DFP73DRAFT_561266 [Morchella snyderi]|nr:hypothetical protein DFP73DRAFT_561266 [Morchella snyderi]